MRLDGHRRKSGWRVGNVTITTPPKKKMPQGNIVPQEESFDTPYPTSSHRKCDREALTPTPARGGSFRFALNVHSATHSSLGRGANTTLSALSPLSRLECIRSGECIFSPSLRRRGLGVVSQSQSYQYAMNCSRYFLPIRKPSSRSTASSSCSIEITPLYPLRRSAAMYSPQRT